MTKKTIVVGIAAVAAIGGAVGGAIAASSDDSPAAEKQAFLNDAAKRLNVAPQALEDALKGAAKARVDAAVAAGRLTKEQGDRLKGAIDAGRLGRLFGGGGPDRAGHGGPGRLGHRGPLMG